MDGASRQSTLPAHSRETIKRALDRRRDAGLPVASQRQLAAALGLSEATVSRLLRGKLPATLGTIEQIARLLELDLAEALGMGGSSVRPGSPAHDTGAGLRPEDVVPIVERVVDERVQQLREELALRAPAGEVPERSVFLPERVFDTPPLVATVGAARATGEEETVGFIDLDEPRAQGDRRRRRGLLAMRVGARATCMAPEIEPGDDLWIDDQAAPRDGQVVVYLLRDDAQQLPNVKRYYRRGRTIILVPNVGEGQVYADREVDLTGVVVRVIKPPPRAVPLPAHLEPGFYPRPDGHE